MEQGILKTLIMIIIITFSFTIMYVITKRIILYKIKHLNVDNPVYNRQITALKLGLSSMKYLVFLTYIFVILIVVGVKVSSIMTSLGLFSIAIGFGAKSIVEDFISGFFIFFERQYDVGDVVKIEDFKGEVVSLGFKTTVLKNWVGDLYVIGNGKIFSIINYSQANSVAVVNLQVAIDTDLNVLNEIVEKRLPLLVDEYDLFIENPDYKGVTDFKASGVSILITAITLPMRHIEGERILRKELLELFNSNGIELAYPKIRFVGEKDV